MLVIVLVIDPFFFFSNKLLFCPIAVYFPIIFWFLFSSVTYLYRLIFDYWLVFLLVFRIYLYEKSSFLCIIDGNNFVVRETTFIT